jgi:hypothetical protein
MEPRKKLTAKANGLHRKRDRTEETVAVKVTTRKVGNEDHFWCEPTDLLRCQVALPETWGAQHIGIEFVRHGDETLCVQRHMYTNRYGIIVDQRRSHGISFTPGDQLGVLEFAMVVLTDLIKTLIHDSGHRVNAEIEGLNIIKTVRSVLLDFASLIADDNTTFHDSTVDTIAHVLCKVAVAEAGGEPVQPGTRYPKNGIDKLDHISKYAELSAQST